MHPLLGIEPTLHRVPFSGRPVLIGKNLAEFQFRGRARKGEPPQSLAIKNVCAQCNNGWMSAVEEAARPALTPLVKGEPHVFTVEAQRLVAIWATLKVMVLDGQFAHKKTIPESECFAFAKNSVIPSRLRLWIAPTKPNGWRVSSERLWASVYRNPNSEHLGNAHSLILGVGNFLLFALYAPFPVEIKRVAPIIDAMYPLVPPFGEDISWLADWPPGYHGTDDEIAALCASVRNSFSRIEFRPAKRQTRLRIIHPVSGASGVDFLEPEARLVAGNELEDLLCGSCGNMLGEGVSIEGVKAQLTTDGPQLYLRCGKCRSFNEIAVYGGKEKRRGK